MNWNCCRCCRLSLMILFKKRSNSKGGGIKFRVRGPTFGSRVPNESQTLYRSATLYRKCSKNRKSKSLQKHRVFRGYRSHFQILRIWFRNNYPLTCSAADKNQGFHVCFERFWSRKQLWNCWNVKVILASEIEKYLRRPAIPLKKWSSSLQNTALPKNYAPQAKFLEIRLPDFWFPLNHKIIYKNSFSRLPRKFVLKISEIVGNLIFKNQFENSRGRYLRRICLSGSGSQKMWCDVI